MISTPHIRVRVLDIVLEGTRETIVRKTLTELDDDDEPGRGGDVISYAAKGCRFFGGWFPVVVGVLEVLGHYFQGRGVGFFGCHVGGGGVGVFGFHCGSEQR